MFGSSHPVHLTRVQTNRLGRVRFAVWVPHHFLVHFRTPFPPGQ
jgi:hypothetical protein